MAKKSTRRMRKPLDITKIAEFADMKTAEKPAEKPAGFTRERAERTERRDVRANGHKTVIRIRPSIWSAFVKLVAKQGTNTQKVINTFRVNNPAEDLPKAIESYIADAGETVYSFGTRECWLQQAIDALRPIFAERGYPLPEKIRASVGFTSKGHRGKRVGECWSTGASADGTVEIFLDPSKIADALGLVDVLTHELCHAWQAGQGKKLGHGADFKRCGIALNLEGKPAEMRGGKEWRDWAAPIVESLGPCPYAKMAEFMAKVKEKKQTTRMLKFEHAECPGMEDGDSHIWRSSGKGIAMRETVCCPCCGTPIPNPNFGDDEPDEVPEDQQ